jgi:hypothetical protein
MDCVLGISAFSNEIIIGFVRSLDTDGILQIQNAERTLQKSIVAEILAKKYDLFEEVMSILKLRTSVATYKSLLHYTMCNLEIPMECHPIGICYATHGMERTLCLIHKYYESNLWFLHIPWTNEPCISEQEACVVGRRRSESYTQQLKELYEK